MKGFLALMALLLVSSPCGSRPASEEDSVVSVYTTLPSTAGTGPTLDVYRQIADNIADRITQPFYRLFGLANSTQAPTTTKRPFEHIELSPDNKTSPDRDVEEISIDSTHKSDKKPEKITLFSSYLPIKQNFQINETNDTVNDIDSDINLDDNSLELDDVDNDDDDDSNSGRGGPFVYILELVGSIIQLLWGGFLAIFKPSGDSDRQVDSSTW